MDEQRAVFRSAWHQCECGKLHIISLASLSSVCTCGRPIFDTRIGA